MIVLEQIPLVGYVWHDTETGRRWRDSISIVATEPCQESGGDVEPCMCTPCAARRLTDAAGRIIPQSLATRAKKVAP